MRPENHSPIGRVLTVAAAGAIVSLAIPAFAQETIPTWVKEHNDRWYAALNSGNAVSLMKMYTADAVVLSPTQTVRGRAAIEAYQRKDFEQTRFQCSWKLWGAQVLQKQAAVWG
jgi:ketosteroid isomerase-like protein